MKKDTSTKALHSLFLILFAAFMLFAPVSSPIATTTGTVTAEAATTTSVKALTKGKTYTVSGYTKVKSSDTSIATAKKKSSKKYTITGKKKGTTVLKCYNSSGKLTRKIYLIVTTSSSFQYDTSSITLTAGKTKTVKATVQSGCTVKYSSSKTSVATVSSKGKITAKKAGTATISAKVYYKGTKIKTLKKKVTVKAASSSSSSSTPALSVSYDTSSVTISPGKTVTAKATVTSGYTVAYSSSDTSVATVSSSGVITGVKGGTATITVKVSYNGTVQKTLTKAVTVRTYKLSNSSLSIDKGSTGTLKCTTSSGSYSSSDTFTWSSSDTSVATVTGSGYSATITGVAAGTATITCKVNSKVTFTCSVTVSSTYTNRLSTSIRSVAGGSPLSIGIWCENETDEVRFELSNDNLQIADIEGPTAGYDSYNQVNAYDTIVHTYGRKAGTCDLSIYINDALFKTITITITSTDTYYYEYVTWKADLEAKLWTSDMTDLEKIVAFGDYVFGSQPYSSNHSPYGYAQGWGGSCWASAYLLVDLAHDLGYEAEVVFPYYEYNLKGYSPTHAWARIHIGDNTYVMEATNSSSDPYGHTSYGIRN